MIERADPLPGDPPTWRAFRAGLKKLMARAELTAVAVERISTGPDARSAGLDSIADATVGRKIADRNDPVDARSVRIIVGACALAAARRGETLPDADVDAWLQARTSLAENVAPAPVPAPPASPPPQRVRRRWAAAALAAALIGVTATVLGATRADDESAGRGVATTASSATNPDLVSGTPPCINPPDKPTGAGLSMTAPVSGTMLVGDTVEARGTVTLAPDERPPWLLLYAIGACTFYLIAPVMVSGDTWAGTLYVDPTQHGTFVAYVMVVDGATDQQLHDLAAASRSPFIVRLPVGARVAHVTIRCCA